MQPQVETVKKTKRALSLAQNIVRDIEAGAHSPGDRLPHEDEMLARYEWGDLRYTTKKEFRNLKKKTSRKGPKGPKTIQIKKGAHFVSFS